MIKDIHTFPNVDTSAMCDGDIELIMISRKGLKTMSGRSWRDQEWPASLLTYIYCTSWVTKMIWGEGGGGGGGEKGGGRGGGLMDIDIVKYFVTVFHPVGDTLRDSGSTVSLMESSCFLNWNKPVFSLDLYNNNYMLILKIHFSVTHPNQILVDDLLEVATTIIL